MAKEDCSECPFIDADECPTCANHEVRTNTDPCEKCSDDTQCGECWVTQENAESAYFGSLGN